MCRCRELQIENREEESPAEHGEPNCLSVLISLSSDLWTYPAVNTIYAQSFENFLKHCLKFWWFSNGGNLGLIKTHPTSKMVVIKPAWILVTVAKPNPGLASRLLIIIGVTVAPNEDPAVTIDVANERLLSK
ncbi:hypothetical protein NP233_g2898 [Leucocoprinus birnbaumii]|uniref:Uncharacterized protein n=1 Tax=Leucocoprinus birnbaumii TaxID=56174 RepID=A0AAD5VY33_9AGAR|nr:hypothetical protein NP233_g2898 [Leucocoprinus birnbaumii]